MVTWIVFAFGVLALTLAGGAVFLAAFWFLMNREPAAESASPDDLDSLAATLYESSTEFDLPDLPVFLRRIALHFAKGFGEREISRLVSAAEQLPHNRERQFDLQVSFHGAMTPLRVRLFKDDVASVGVYFFTSKELMELLDREIQAFFKERRM